MHRNRCGCQEKKPPTCRWFRNPTPPPDKRIRFDDDSFWKFPQLRWSLSNMRMLVTTTNVPRIGGTPSELGQPGPGDAAGIDALRFTDMHGRQRTWAESLGQRAQTLVLAQQGATARTVDRLLPLVDDTLIAEHDGLRRRVA